LTEQAAGQAPIRLAVLHAEARAEAEELLARVREKVNYVDSFLDNLTTSIAVHFGPGALGTVVYPEGTREGK
jgi:fatty acid-binding protein DegV